MLPTVQPITGWQGMENGSPPSFNANSKRVQLNKTIASAASSDRNANTYQLLFRKNIIVDWYDEGERVEGSSLGNVGKSNDAPTNGVNRMNKGKGNEPQIYYGEQPISALCKPRP
jgi:hypothetical protein